MKKIVAALTLFLLLGCSAAETMLNGGAAIEGAAGKTTAAQPVQLFYAKAIGNYSNNSLYATVKGFIEIENLAYSKVVVVRYTINGTVWKESAAKYVKMLNGKEVWTFQVNGLPYDTANNFMMKFAVRYTVNGKDYWDNNGGLNYQLLMRPDYTIYTDVAFGKSVIALDTATAYIYNNGACQSEFVCHFFVNYGNTAPPVAVRYTLDNWKTSYDAFAVCKGTYSDNAVIETWYTADVVVPSNTTNIRFAAYANINGSFAWDNNFGFGSDYQITCPLGAIRGTEVW